MDDHGSIERGTVGWAGEPDFLDIEEDGLTYIRVTLSRGRNHTTEGEERAQGAEVLCQWGMLIDAPLKRDMQVIVAFPAGMGAQTGAGVIIGRVRPAGGQFKSDRAVLDLGDDVHVILKGKSVSLQDYASPARYFYVGTSRAGGPPGIGALDETGSGFTVQGGVLGFFCASGSPADVKVCMQLTSTYAECGMMDGTSKWRIEANQCLTFGATNLCSGAGVYLGKVPTVATTALYGVTGVAGVASTSVYISP